MFDLLKKKKDLKQEWNTKGEKYAKGINEMVEFGEKNGWDNWKGKEPEDKREHLAKDVIKLLRQANLEGKVNEFRTDFPPSHSPLISLLNKKSQSIEQLCHIEGQKIIFVTGTPYEQRQAYLLDENNITKLDSDIKAIGKSKQNNIFAIATNNNKVSICKGWEGELINEFTLKETADYGITELIPFNDGSKIILVTSEGIYLISKDKELLIHPEKDEDDDEWTPNIDMENATISNDNKYIVAGDQCYDHRILDNEGHETGSIGPQSSYPHFCLFSKDDSQLITNSCHFYNGVTIGVDTKKLNDINIEAYSESDDYIYMDEGMRVYAGLSTSDYYILGDAYGYIRAIDKNGNKIWQYFLGSTISGMTISDDEKTLWVGSHSGILHKLLLDKGHRDTHTIGTGKHYEEFRLLFWKDEQQVWRW